MRLLIADDNEGDLWLLALTIEEAKIECEITQEIDSESVLATIEAAERERKPLVLDLFVLDLFMPKLGGLELAKEIRMYPHFDRVPIVILTSVLTVADQKVIDQIPFCFPMLKPTCLEEWKSLGEILRTIVTCKDPSQISMEPFAQQRENRVTQSARKNSVSSGSD